MWGFVSEASRQRARQGVDVQRGYFLMAVMLLV